MNAQLVTQSTVDTQTATRPAESMLQKSGYLLVVILSAGLLVDAAVETFQAGSHQRWPIVAAAVAAITIVVFLLRRRLVFVAAACSFLTLLGLFAISAWLPDAENGVVLFRQSSTAVLSAVCAAGLLWATVVVVRFRRLPRGLSIALAMLALYGAAAFGAGAINAVPLADLLHGQSLWTVFPRWLQGAFLGGLIVLPVAIVLEITDLIRRPGHHRALISAVAVLMIGVVALSGLRSRTTVGDRFASSRADTPSSPSDTLDGRQTFGQPAAAAAGGQTPSGVSYLAELAKLKASIDFSAVDVRALQAKIGSNPQTIFQFMQDRVRFEAYGGVLRGARGTLMARAGNSLDRALLQAALLNAAGHRTRLAAGTISVAQAEALVRSGLKPPHAVAAPDLNAIVDRALGHFVLLGNTLDDAGFKPPTGDAGRWDRTVREAQAHAWVQLDNNGQWLDVDSSPGVAYGRTLVAPARSFDAVDPKTFDEVEFAVDVETEQDGKTETHRVLEHKAHAADLAGVVIGLFHERAAQSATPVLLIGDQRIPGTAFTSEPTALGGVIGRSILPAFGGSPALMTGEWLRLHVTGPTDDRTASFTIVDTIGPAARGSGQLPADSPAARQAVADTLDAVLGISVVTGRVPTSLPATLLSDLSDPLTAQGVARMLAIQNATYAALRDLIPSSFFAAAPASYVDAPAVVISRAQPHRRPTGDPSFVLSMDLTLKASRILRPPDDPLRAAGSFYDNLAAGVIDHTVERWMIADGDGGASVGGVFEAAVASDLPLGIAKSGDVTLTEPLTPDGRSRLSATLVKGQVDILPKGRPPGWSASLGWWSIDPSSGWTEDTNEEGCHPELVERGSKDSAFKGAYRAICQVGRVVAGATILTIAITQAEPWSEEEVAQIVQWVCDTVNGRPRGPSSGPSRPPVPPPGPAKPGFPPTSPKFPSPPRPPKGPPDVPQWWSSNGSWRKWR